MKKSLAVLALMALPAHLGAHEFWIDPITPQVDEGMALLADIRVGDKLSGGSYSFVPPNFTRFEIVLGDAVFPVEGRAGDKPALNMAVDGQGLASVVHVTRDYKLTYTDWEKFKRFCAHKDFEWAISRHLERGLGQDRVREQYSRHAKSLIAIGEGVGQDRRMGLLTEIVALTNPYTDDLTSGFDVQVFYQDTPLADVQVEVFEKAPDGSLNIELYRSNAEGQATIAVKPGHFYLVDHVVMRELTPDDPSKDASWESLWASLTFTVPD